MAMNKYLKYYAYYELAVTGYNALAARMTSLPALPFPSLLTMAINSFAPSLLSAGTSAAGQQAMLANGTTITLGSDAVYNAAANTLTTGGTVFPVALAASASGSGGIWQLGTPATPGATVGTVTAGASSS